MNSETITLPASAPSRAADRLQQAMLWLLAFFLFALPLVEAPKNLAAAAYLLVWGLYVGRTRDFGGPWNRYDTVFAATLASATVSGLAGYYGDVPGVYRVFLLAWAVSRTPLPESSRRLLPLSACLGVVLAIVIAAVPFLDGRKTFLELLSVGHVNQSALYIAIMTACAFGWWLQSALAGSDARMRWSLAISAVVCCAALLAGASRAAEGAGALAALVIVGGVLSSGRSPRLRRMLAGTALTVVVLAGLAAVLGARDPGLSDNKLTAQGLLSLNSTETRIKHWRIAYEGWREHPWLGWGPESFQQLTVDDVCHWRAERGETCDRSLYLPQVHAHSLYMGTLAERGLVGMATLVLLLAVWTWSLVRSLPTASWSWLWPASASGLLIVAVAGTFNTTMRVEHGSLAVLFFGLWIAVHGRAAAAASARR
jgi:O-antigen ligase